MARECSVHGNFSSPGWMLRSSVGMAASPDSTLSPIPSRVSHYASQAKTPPLLFSKKMALQNTWLQILSITSRIFCDEQTAKVAKSDKPETLLEPQRNTK